VGRGACGPPRIAFRTRPAHGRADADIWILPIKRLRRAFDTTIPGPQCGNRGCRRRAVDVFGTRAPLQPGVPQGDPRLVRGVPALYGPGPCPDAAAIEC